MKPRDDAEPQVRFAETWLFLWQLYIHAGKQSVAGFIHMCEFSLSDDWRPEARA